MSDTGLIKAEGVGIEPTATDSTPAAYGFEVRAGHQTESSSDDNIGRWRVEFTGFWCPPLDRRHRHLQGIVDFDRLFENKRLTVALADHMPHAARVHFDQLEDVHAGMVD
jgi:hypothetical protein